MEYIENPRSVCPVCGCQKPRNRHICWECHKIYGASDRWPEWLKLIVNDNERWRYEFARQSENEVPLGDYEVDDDGNLVETPEHRASLLNPDPWR